MGQFYSNNIIESIIEKALHLEINKTKTLFKIPLFLMGIGTSKNGWDNKHPSRSYFGYSYNHQRLLK